MYTVTTQSTDSVRICEPGCSFRAVPLQSKGAGFCYLAPATTTKQLLGEGCFLVRQLTLSEIIFWRAISNQHQVLAARSSGWWTTAAAMRLNERIHVICLVEFLIPVNAKHYDDHCLFFFFSWRSTQLWHVKFVRELGEYSLGCEWYRIWVWIKVRGHWVPVGTGLK